MLHLCQNPHLHQYNKVRNEITERQQTQFDTTVYVLKILIRSNGENDNSCGRYHPLSSIILYSRLYSKLIGRP